MKRGTVNMVVTKYSLIGALLQSYPETAETVSDMGMQCLSCSMSPRENLEQACAAHNINVDELVSRLDQKINGSQE